MSDRDTVKLPAIETDPTIRAWDLVARRRAEVRRAVETVAVEMRLVTPAIRAALIPALPKVVPVEPYLAKRAPGKRCAITLVEMMALRALAGGAA